MKINRKYKPEAIVTRKSHRKGLHYLHLQDETLHATDGRTAVRLPVEIHKGEPKTALISVDGFKQCKREARVGDVELRVEPHYVVSSLGVVTPLDPSPGGLEGYVQSLVSPTTEKNAPLNYPDIDDLFEGALKISRPITLDLDVDELLAVAAGMGSNSVRLHLVEGSSREVIYVTSLEKDNKADGLMCTSREGVK